MPLLLSLIYLMLGDIQKGEQFARQGIEIGKQLDSPFVEAVGLMRLGHAYQLYPHVPWRNGRLEKAKAFYERSIELVNPFNVVRVQAEPLWGLCRYYGYQGNLQEAYQLAIKAIDVAESPGDFWFGALLRTTLGTSYLLSGKKDLAEEWLHKAMDGFESVEDIFGKSAAKCALALNEWLNGQTALAISSFSEIAPTLREQNLGFLITQPSHLGIQDTLLFFPLLIEARRQGVETEWIQSLLGKFGMNELQFHPGYDLKVRTLGAFDVWRGNEFIYPREWQREKARQLFQFFISNRGKWYSREQITDRLWREMDADSSAQNLKVAMNSLNRALEPERESGAAPFFIIRRENLYGLNPSAEIRTDSDDFVQLAASTNRDDLIEALAIYKGKFLGENSGEVWVSDLQVRLQDEYLNAARKLCDLLFSDSQWDTAIKYSHEMLTQDPCNEYAYGMLMKCHAAKGNRSTVHSIYQRCRAVLREELDVEPAPETTRLWEALTK
jgi:DNA-binding SARP family transcriptional activator